MNFVSFIIDGMLGSLARKLRLLGYDTLYYSDVDDEKLIEIAAQQNRVIITRDKLLYKRAMNSGIISVLLDGSSDIRDMVHVLRNFGISSVEFLPEKSRCSLCNSELDKCDKSFANKIIPAKVTKMHERFYFCHHCNKVYWGGSHFTKLQEFGITVRKRLNNAS